MTVLSTESRRAVDVLSRMRNLVAHSPRSGHVQSWHAVQRDWARKLGRVWTPGSDPAAAPWSEHDLELTPLEALMLKVYYMRSATQLLGEVHQHLELSTSRIAGRAGREGPPVTPGDQ
jgi:hypothetical protein